jgi:hypothetical protein
MKMMTIMIWKWFTQNNLSLNAAPIESSNK